MRSKYNNKKTTVDGYIFDSKKEAKRYGVLKMMVLAKEVFNLKMQVKFELIPKQKGLRATNYFADFTYEINDKSDTQTPVTIVEDVKGKKTDVYMIKKKLMKFIHNIDIYET